MSSFSVRPFDVLHDDEVRAVGLSAVVDRDDVRMREPGGVRGLAPEALDELIVVRVPLVEDLDGHAPPELLVLGEVDVRHPTAPELARDAVAGGEERAGERVGGRPCCVEVRDSLAERRIASMTSRAIGAAVVPPVPLWFWSTTATASSAGLSSSGPANAMNQVVFEPGTPVSPVPVLPPTE